jgi:hypothetical protein
MRHLGCKTQPMREEPRTEDRQVLERLALGEWSPQANARVVSVTVAGNRAEVALFLNGDYGYWMYFQRDDEGWCETVSGNGPTGFWDDPTVIGWETASG